MAKVYGLGAKQQNTLFSCITKAYTAKGIDAGDPSTWENTAPTFDMVYSIYANDEEIKKNDSLAAAMDTLYSNLIQQVESDLNIKFEELIRKKNFFSRIYIDKSFSVHILRNEKINTSDLSSLLRTGSVSVATNVLGETAIATLQERYKVTNVAELRKALFDETAAQILLPVEISKDRLSSGEKQIFVMSLYWAMMNQSKNELPFIIDTPFARIDAEHRANITEYFFKGLTGQLLILSTDEELSSNHLEAMRSQISHVYMLEYGQDKRTHIRENQYFEV